MFIHESNTERGNAVLYAVLLVPFAFFLTTIAVDISAWNATRDKLQQEADRLAFQGLGGLPDQNEVRTRVDQAAEQIKQEAVQVNVFFPNGVTQSSVGVTLTSQYKPRFGLFSFVNLGDAFKISRTGIAQVVPGDFVIIVADGASLRPPLGITNGEFGVTVNYSAWGTEADWPASAYFQRVSPLVIKGNALGWNWWMDWNKLDFQRWATQSCFNPVFSPLKFAAVGISEALLAYGVNRIGFVYTPGEQTSQGFRVLRHVHGESDEPELYPGQIGGFPDMTRVTASWGDYRELEQFLGDSACVLFSDPIASISPRYVFPSSGTNCEASGEGILANTSTNIAKGRHELSDHFSSCYNALGLSLRDAIYWNAAKLNMSSFPAQPNIIASLQQAWAELTDDRTLALEQRVRGNLAHNSLRQILVLTDSLPPGDAPGLQQLLDNFQSKHIQVTVGAFLHQGLTPAASEALQANVGAWQNLALSYSKVLRVTLSPDPITLQTQVVPQFLSSALRFALRT